MIRQPGPPRARSAPATRSHTSISIRPDIHARFLRVLAKVDAEIAARAAEPLVNHEPPPVHDQDTPQTEPPDGEWT